MARWIGQDHSERLVGGRSSSRQALKLKEDKGPGSITRFMIR